MKSPSHERLGQRKNRTNAKSKIQVFAYSSTAMEGLLSQCGVLKSEFNLIFVEMTAKWFVHLFQCSNRWKNRITALARIRNPPSNADFIYRSDLCKTIAFCILHRFCLHRDKLRLDADYRNLLRRTSKGMKFSSKGSIYCALFTIRSGCDDKKKRVVNNILD